MCVTFNEAMNVSILVDFEKNNSWEVLKEMVNLVHTDRIMKT